MTIIIFAQGASGYTHLKNKIKLGPVKVLRYFAVQSKHNKTT